MTRWVRDNAAALKAEGISQADALEISDHADEANECILGPLLTAVRLAGRFDEDAAALVVDEADAVAEGQQIPVLEPAKQIRVALEEALEWASDAGPSSVGILMEIGAIQHGEGESLLSAATNSNEHEFRSLMSNLAAFDPKIVTDHLGNRKVIGAPGGARFTSPSSLRDR